VSDELQTTDAESVTVQPDPRRWKALFVLALIQFMLVLDVTVVNVALPRSSRTWALPTPDSPGWSTVMC